MIALAPALLNLFSMKYALHASLHRPARRPDQTASSAVESARRGAEGTCPPDYDADARDPDDASNGVRASRPSFLPPPAAVVRRTDGRPTFASTPPGHVINTDPDRPTLRLPAVPPPEGASTSGLNATVRPAAEVPTQPMIMQQADPAPVIDANEPTLEEKPVRVEDMNEEQDAYVPVTRNRVAQPRKKGAPQPRRASPVHRMPEIDPAAWLADEAHARTSDRRDSADGVDNSDTIVPTPRPTHYV